MLADFLSTNRAAIIEGSRARVAERSFPAPSRPELANGIPVFLDQLGAALRLAESSDVIDHVQIANSARRHGADLLRMGLTIAQVVHDYGDVCQTVTELAIEQGATIPGSEFRVLNLCLDDAIAGAVTEYADQRERAIEEAGTERLGVLAHELRNLLTTSMLTFGSIRSGRVAPGGSTGVLHGRSLLGLRSLVDRTLADVRLDAGATHAEHICVADFVEEIDVGAQLQAEARGLSFRSSSVSRALTIGGDRHILAAAVSNLLQNAFKFTAKGSRVLFEVEDECGGLPPGKAEELFRPYAQKGVDRSGLGLGLSICRKAAKANGGELYVRDLPGKGCVFTLDLPRAAPPPITLVDLSELDSAALGAAVAAGAGDPSAPKAIAS